MRESRSPPSFRRALAETRGLLLFVFLFHLLPDSPARGEAPAEAPRPRFLGMAAPAVGGASSAGLELADDVFPCIFNTRCSSLKLPHAAAKIVLDVDLG